MNRYLHDGTYRISFSPRTFSPFRRYTPFVARKLIKLSLAVSLMSHPCVTGIFSPSLPLQHAAYQTGLATPGPFVNHQDYRRTCVLRHNHTTHTSESAQRARVQFSQLTAVQQYNFKLLDIQLVIYFKTHTQQKRTMVRILRCI